jgi:5-methylcytosine-specific restriction endonuclease McrA
MRTFYTILFSFLLFQVICFSQETYKVGKTEYYYNQYYQTTGKPVVKRSEANKREFLKSLGYKNVPKGYEVDHIIPLSKGGADEPYNMQLLKTEDHARKTAKEASNRSNSTYNRVPVYKSNNTGYYQQINKGSFYSPSFKSNTYQSPKTIYTGPRGGKYYINSSGNKTYIKK